MKELSARALPISFSRAVLLIVALAFFLRFAFGLSQLAKPLDTLDQDRYLPFAKSLWAGQGFSFNGRPTAYRPPLYPLVLAPLVGTLGEGTAFRLGLIVLQSGMGAATAWLASQIAMKMATSSNRAESCGILAGILTAADPVLLSQASLPMTETLAAFLLTLSLYFISREDTVPAGLSFGLASLSRPSILACFAIVIVALIYCHRNNLRRSFKYALLLSACTFLVILPWGIRNYFAIGWPVFTTTHGGYTFALANNDVYYEEVLNGPPGAIWSGARQQSWFDSIGPSVKGLSEHEMDETLKARTWAFVRQNPQDFVRATIDRQRRFWAVSPSSQVYGRFVRYSSTVWTLPFWLLVVCGLFRPVCRTWPGLSVVGAIAGLASVHLIYWTDIRMRAPIVPALAIVASQSLGTSKKFWQAVPYRPK